MKKIYLSLLMFLFISAASHATIWTVSVANFSFTPNNLNVNVSDTIRWVWASGGHTTTSTSVPATATPWDHAIDNNSTTFDYVVMVAGTYTYHCDFHPSMVGNITAMSTSGISTPESQIDFNVLSLNNSAFTFNYALKTSAHINLSIADITGKVVRVLESELKAGGEYSQTYYFSDLNSGIYLVQLSSGSQRISRRIVVE